MESSFRILDYKVIDSEIKISNIESDCSKFEFSLVPSGRLNLVDRTFLLDLRLDVFAEDRSFFASVHCIAKFSYEYAEKDDTEVINNYIYISAISITFPYIRAYINTLTSASGIRQINLPIINTMYYVDELKANIVTV